MFHVYRSNNESWEICCFVCVMAHNIITHAHQQQLSFIKVLDLTLMIKMIKDRLKRVCGACLHLLPHHYSKKGNLICSRCSRVHEGE